MEFAFFSKIARKNADQLLSVSLIFSFVTIFFAQNKSQFGGCFANRESSLLKLIILSRSIICCALLMTSQQTLAQSRQGEQIRTAARQPARHGCFAGCMTHYIK